MPVPDTSKSVRHPCALDVLDLQPSLKTTETVDDPAPRLKFAVLHSLEGGDGGTKREDSNVVEDWHEKVEETSREREGGFAAFTFATCVTTDVGEAGEASNKNARPCNALDLADVDGASGSPAEVACLALLEPVRSIKFDATPVAAGEVGVGSEQRCQRSWSASNDSINGQPRKLSASRRGQVMAMDRTDEFDNRGQNSRRSLRRAFPLIFCTLIRGSSLL
jgi:hypothetical protein